MTEALGETGRIPTLEEELAERFTRYGEMVYSECGGVGGVHVRSPFGFTFYSPKPENVRPLLEQLAQPGTDIDAVLDNAFRHVSATQA